MHFIRVPKGATRTILVKGNQKIEEKKKGKYN
jgi:hypothetical protein